jgi:pimeloyl-ACP methyl ester carboxylesterase
MSKTPSRRRATRPTTRRLRAPARARSAVKPRSKPKRKTYVLVHGAWHGGWCWVRVARLLRARGHEVYTPTLTGLGERSHLLHPDIDLSTHIDDVVNLIKWEGLTGIVLVGHSYGGFVISGVAEKCADKISSIVFLDAFIPDSGQRMIDITSARTREAILAAQQRGESTTAPISAAFFNVNEKDRAWVDEMCRPHPIKTFLQPISLTGARERIARKTYVRAANYPNPGFDSAMARAKAARSWRVFEAPCGHDVMVDLPDKLAAILRDA